MFAVKTFAALTFLALKPMLKSEPEITIDLEYPGYEALIKNELVSHARRTNLPLGRSTVTFASIGKRSPAHDLAWKALRRGGRARRVSLAELAELLKL